MKVSGVSLLMWLVLWSVSAVADEASEREAEILLSSMGLESSIQQSMSQMIEIQLQQNPALDPFKGVMMEFFAKHMSWESLKPELLRIYAEAFTADELRELNRFYATDTGQKTIRMMPTLMAQGAQIGVARVQDNMAELQAMIQSEAERLEKEANQ